MPKQVQVPSPWEQEEELEPIMRDTKLLDAETHKPQIIDTIVYQDDQEDPEDEVQQGGGNVLRAGAPTTT